MPARMYRGLRPLPLNAKHPGQGVQYKLELEPSTFGCSMGLLLDQYSGSHCLVHPLGIEPSPPAFQTGAST